MRFLSHYATTTAAAWWFWIITTAPVIDATGSSIQSGPFPGATYAGGMIYDKERLIITGSTYGALGASNQQPATSCYVGLLEYGEDLQFLDQDTLGTSTIHEECISLVRIGSGTLQTAILGASQPGGLFQTTTTTTTTEEEEEVVGGFLMCMEFTRGLVVGPKLGGIEVPPIGIMIRMCMLYP
jgi:hypothetical protein